MRMNKELHPRNVDRLYISRMEEGRGLIKYKVCVCVCVCVCVRVCMYVCVTAEENSLGWYVTHSTFDCCCKNQKQ